MRGRGEGKGGARGRTGGEGGSRERGEEGVEGKEVKRKGRRGRGEEDQGSRGRAEGKGVKKKEEEAERGQQRTWWRGTRKQSRRGTDRCMGGDSRKLFPNKKVMGFFVPPPHHSPPPPPPGQPRHYCPSRQPARDSQKHYYDNYTFTLTKITKGCICWRYSAWRLCFVCLRKM